MLRRLLLTVSNIHICLDSFDEPMVTSQEWRARIPDSSNHRINQGAQPTTQSNTSSRISSAGRAANRNLNHPVCTIYFLCCLFTYAFR